MIHINHPVHKRQATQTRVKTISPLIYLQSSCSKNNCRLVRYNTKRCSSWKHISVCSIKFKLGSIIATVVTLQKTRLTAALTLTDTPTVKFKDSRKSLRAWELSNNPSNPPKLKASPGKYAETAVVGIEPPV